MGNPFLGEEKKIDRYKAESSWFSLYTGSNSFSDCKQNTHILENVNLIKMTFLKTSKANY